MLTSQAKAEREHYEHHVQRTNNELEKHKAGLQSLLQLKGDLEGKLRYEAFLWSVGAWERVEGGGHSAMCCEGHPLPLG